MNQYKVLFVFGIVFFSLISLKLKGDFIGHGGMIRDIAFSENDKFVLTGSFDYSAILWDFQDQRLIKSLDGHEGPVTSVAFVTEKKAITASDDNTAIFWDLDTGSPIFKFAAHTHKVMSASVSPDRRYVATGGWDTNIFIWDLKTGQKVKRLKVKTPVNSVAFLGGSELIAVGGHDGIIYLLNVESTQLHGKLEGHQMGITSLSSSRNGARLLSASIDGSVVLWDVVGFSKIRKFRGHGKQVYSVKFLNGDKFAISSGADGSLIHWNVTTGLKIKKIQAHKTLGWAVAPSKDGRFIVSAGGDDPAKVWHLATGDQINANQDVIHEPKPWLKSNHPGSLLFKKCAKCHAIKESVTQRSGPHLENIFGRPIGSVPGYNYSDALKKAKIIWDHETIAQLFKLGPDKYLPGTKMPIQRINNDQQLHDLVTYLKELTSGGFDTQ